MKSFYSMLVLSFIFLLGFGGLLAMFDEVKDPDRLDNESSTLYTTLNSQYDQVSFEELNVTQVELGIQNEDAFAAEFYSASTDSQKKQGTLDKIKNIPNLIRFSIGQEDSFSWAWAIAMSFIIAIVALIGFVIIFKREVFR